MPNDHMFMAKIKGQEPEQFIFITVSEDYSRITRTSDPMSEKELRAKLHDLMMPDVEVCARIEHARKHPA